MARLSNTAEGGSNGDGTGTAAVSVGNSGGTSGDAFSTVTITSPSTVTFDPTAAYKGGFGYLFVNASTSGKNLVTLAPGSPTNQTACRFYINFTSFPSSLMVIAQGTNGTTTNRIQVAVNNSGAMQVLDSTSTATTGWSGATTTSASNLSLSTWYRIEFSVDNSAASGAGNTSIGALTVYDQDTANISAGNITWSNGGCNLGSTSASTIAGFNLGRAATGTQTCTFGIDDIALDTGGTTFIGASAAVWRPPSRFVAPSLAAIQAASW